MTQGQQLLQACRRKPRTYGELLAMGISTCPHKRLAESRHHLKPGERLLRSTNARGLVTFSVTRAG